MKVLTPEEMEKRISDSTKKPIRKKRKTKYEHRIRKYEAYKCPCKGCVWHEETTTGCDCSFPSDVPHDHIIDSCCENYERS